ncbi:MAG: divergent PAP2 family protein [Oscillospiraceae bacterium]|nr:divergent PAP2 family protein [Oscillospiraceae bacterium]
MNDVVNAILSNSIFCNPVLAWIAAQLIKTIITRITTGRFSAERLMGSGGMPSSHAAVMAALTTTVARVDGIYTSTFAICFVVSWVVMYDAIGVRWNAGQHAKLLNRISRILELDVEDKQYEDLQELLGHRPIEVLVGILFGISIGIFMPVLR